MAKIILIIFFALTSNLAFSQLTETEKHVQFGVDSVFIERFNNNTNSKGWDIVNNDTYTSNIINGKYICNMPYDNEENWRWTWVDLPKSIKDIFNKSSRVNLSFDLSMDDNIDGNGFALLFDLHNVTKRCPGGDFYELYFTKSGEKLNTNFRKNNNCHPLRSSFFRGGISTTLKKQNTISVHKAGTRWSILVNDSTALELDLAGDISLDRLKFNKGSYSFDNFLVNVIDITNSGGNLVPRGRDASAKVWAICIGVNDYRGYLGSRMPNLEFCMNDASEYYKFLLSAKGGKVPPGQVALLLNDQATEINVLNEAERLFSKAGDNDIIIIFMAGHGGRGYYCASNGPLLYEELNRILTGKKASRKLLIADACHAGTWPQQKEVLTPRGKLLTDEEAVELYYKKLEESGRGTAYLLAAGPDESSYEFNGHGIFTNYLLEGLKDCKAKKAGEFVTIVDIHDYILKQVFAATQKEALPQRPLLVGSYDKALPMSVCKP
ncbi:caspase domain-containing protein [Hymenobacter sp. BT491]|uniref:caspase family protein n=1 Tax=Hymenobacter sp. BT491 TaxID=2766779 RepID=UPI0016534907|nr:caspase family protein [Hymenobacter sp. BT491]MBC6992481.1 caspase family protein [Hymenobacter sp. BT491]